MPAAKRLRLVARLQWAFDWRTKLGTLVRVIHEDAVGVDGVRVDAGQKANFNYASFFCVRGGSEGQAIRNLELDALACGISCTLVLTAHS